MAFRHLSWEQRARRVRRRKQRHVAAAAVTLAGGQLAWMVTQGADPAGALEVNRFIDLVSNCVGQTPSCDEFGEAAGGVTAVDISADGRYVAIITDAALYSTDDNFSDDVYVIDRGVFFQPVRWITEGDDPGGFTWTEDPAVTSVAISGDGRFVTWVTEDHDNFFFPPAVPVADGDDNDDDRDVFVATIDVDGDGDLSTATDPDFPSGHGDPMLVSVDETGANLGALHSNLASFEPTISHDGRFIAFTYLTEDPIGSGVGSGEQASRLVAVHDRDADGNGVFDEPSFPDEQTTTFIDNGSLSADNPDISPDGNFVAFRSFDETAQFDESGLVRVWRRSDDTVFDATAGDFTGGLAGTVARQPTLSEDGTKLAYDFEIIDDSVVSDIPFGRNETIVVDVNPGLGTIANPYIASQVPTDPDPTTAISDSTRPSFPALSYDGRYVIYESNADNVAESLGSGSGQIYAVDLLQAAPEDRVPAIASAVGSDPDPVGADEGSYSPAVSANGGAVAFGSRANDPQFQSNIDNQGNAFVQEWQVVVEVDPPGPVEFPDTSVGATSAPVNLVFDTHDFGPWSGQSLDLLDGYTDPAVHDYTVVGGCASPTVSFHANDPCVVQVTFAPVEVGNRTAELCLALFGSFAQCELTTIIGGQALVPDGPGPIVRESLTDDDGQIPDSGAFDPGSRDPAISANGRYIAFETDGQLDPVDQNGLLDVYVRDRLRGTTTLISSGEGIGDIGQDESVNPTISGDGRFLTFESSGDKVPDPTAPEGDGGRSDIFRVDRGVPDPATGDFVPGAATMQIVSVDTDEGGDASFFQDAFDATMSGDGTQIAFTVYRFTGGTDVYIRRLGPGVPTTVHLDGLFPTDPPVGFVHSPDISADGRHLAVVGDTDLGPPLSNIRSSIVYVYDRDVDGDGVLDEANDPTPGQTRLVQVTTGEFTPVGDPQGEPADTRAFGPLQQTISADPAISGDGSTVAYTFSQYYDFDNADLPMDQRLSPLPDSDEQIVVADRDATTGLPAVSELVSMAGPGDPNKTLFDNIADNAARCLTGGEGCAVLPDISDDGRYVTFATEAPNLVVRHAVTLPGADIEGDCGFENCDVLVVDRDATSNAGGPQHVNEPPAVVLETKGFSDQVGRAVGEPTISGDGRFIAFDSDSEYFLGYGSEGPNNFFPFDTNNAFDVFLREWQPVVDASTPLAFPSTVLGATSAPQTGTFSTQDFGPAPVLAVELLGANPGDFLINSSLNCLPPLPGGPADPVPPVPAHARVNLSDPCSVSVAFRPTAEGARSAILRVTTGHPFSETNVAAAANQVTEIPMTGTGAVLVIPGDGGFGSAPTVDFGSQIVTVTSPEVAIPVTNTGDSPFQITDITLAGTNPGDFTIVGTDCIGFLAPGATCTVRVTFTPTAPGDRSATLVFTDTAPGGPHQIGLTGQAPLPTLIVNPGVVTPGRTVQIQGLNWAPGQVVNITTVDAFDLTKTLPGSTQITANAFGGLDGSLLFFPKTAAGPRVVLATGTPNTLTAFQPLLISVATINGLDFVTRG